MRRRQGISDETNGRRSPWVAFWLFLGVAVLTAVAALVVLGLSGRSLPIPDFVVSRIEARANRALQGQASLNIVHADLVVSEGFVPQVSLTNVTLLSAQGQRLATISDLRGSLDGRALLSGRIEPQRLTVMGARLAVRRLADGTFDIAPGANAFSGAARRPAEILDSLDAAFGVPVLAGLQRVRVEGLAILFDDVRSGQVWTVRDGAFDLAQTADAIDMRLGFDLYGSASVSAPTSQPGSGAALGRAELRLGTSKATSEARLSARLNGVSARDLAAQVPVLAWLGALDAPISGAVETGLDRKGDLAPLTARLDLGAGALRPTPDTRPVAFDGAHVELAYDPPTAALAVTGISIDSPSLRVEATGQAWLKGFADGVPDALVGQVRIDRLSANPDGVFARTVTIGEGLADLKVELDPFRIRIGQMVLVDQGRRISARGTISAEPKGWAVALDVGIEAIRTDRLLALWPVKAVPKTRDWLIANVATGELFDVKGAMRIAPGQEPRLALEYRFRGAQVRFLKTLPPVIDGSGYASIQDYAYTVVTEKGRIRAPEGGDLDVSGSVLKVADLRARPTIADVTLKSRGSITATLAILDEPPFRFLSKAGKPVDMFAGMAELSTDLRLPLIRKVALKDLTYKVAGTVTNLRSQVVVPGRLLAADRLSVAADTQGLTVSGKATLDGVPVDGKWTQRFGPEHKGRSRVEGQAELSSAALTAFGVALPEGSVKGLGTGAVVIDLARDKPAAMKLTSDLAGLTLAIPELGWSKPADRTGSLTFEASLSSPPEVTRLDLSAAGLEAGGALTLKPDGGLDRIAFPGLTMEDWFEGDVILTGRGKGRAVGIEVTGGSVDLRRAEFGEGSASGGDPAPVKIALDRLRISDEISLTSFRGDFQSGGGLSGSFSGLVNDTAPVTGTMAPADNGRAAFRVEADNAGLVMASAGIYSSGRGGQMNLSLQPVGDSGHYDGTVGIRSIRVVDAPELAGLLNAISVVGLISQLQGAGIVFSDVQGKFLLTPEAVEIREGSAIGASLGVSAAGIYRSTDRSLDIQGVISPIYLLNGIGQIFSRQRDGLFGFNYRMTGTRDRTEISVNPLSILTPGMFREIFRKAPPKLSQ